MESQILIFISLNTCSNDKWIKYIYLLYLFIFNIINYNKKNVDTIDNYTAVLKSKAVSPKIKLLGKLVFIDFFVFFL